VMVAWETMPTSPDQPVENDFASIWRGADKVVYSKTLEAVATARTRIERDFDPEAIRRMKAQADRDIGVGGHELAAQAIRAGLVDEYQLFLTPIIIGRGKPGLPDDVRVQLDLRDVHRFSSGVVYVNYRATT
jgi:dihydrofolate reductase